PCIRPARSAWPWPGRARPGQARVPASCTRRRRWPKANKRARIGSVESACACDNPGGVGDVKPGPGIGGCRSMFPISDDNPTLRTPIATILLLIALFGAWIFLQGAGLDPQVVAASVCNLGLVPGELTHKAAVGTAVPIGPGLSCVVDNDPINVW